MQTPNQSSMKSRRNLIKGAVAGTVGVAGLAAATEVFLNRSQQVSAAPASNCVTPYADILTIARTAERLAVTFYTNGVKHADRLGLGHDAKQYLIAALIEEQIHEDYLFKAGAHFLATNFSFPHGEATFEHLDLFIATQQQLEGVFDSAYLAAVKEFSYQGHHDLAQVSAQVATIEAEHRVLGRVIGGFVPADNWAFTPVLIAKVGDAPAAVKAAGYLSPVKGNTFTFEHVSTDDPHIVYRTPFSVSCH